MPDTKTVDPLLVAQIVRSYVANNALPPAELGALITSVHQSFMGLNAPSELPASEPAVAIGKSYGRDFVICLDCGWRGLILRRHLSAAHALSPREYRTRWKLRDTHPLTAPAYTERRSVIARQLGLGHHRLTTVAPEPPAPAPAPKRRGRPRNA